MLKTNDVAMIIANRSNHQFNIADTVLVSSRIRNTLLLSDGRNDWYASNLEVELLESYNV